MVAISYSTNKSIFNIPCISSFLLECGHKGEVIRWFVRRWQWRKIIDFHQLRRLRPQARSVKDVVYPFRPAVRITGGLLATGVRIHEATADEFLDQRTVGLRVQITADNPRICRLTGFEALINQLSDLPVSNMLLRGLILLPPSQVCSGDSDNTQFALEAVYQGKMTGVRDALVPIAVIDSSTADKAQPTLSEKHGAAVRFVAPLLRVNAFITFRAEARLKERVGAGLDLL